MVVHGLWQMKGEDGCPWIIANERGRMVDHGLQQMKGVRLLSMDYKQMKRVEWLSMVYSK